MIRFLLLAFLGLILSCNSVTKKDQSEEVNSGENNQSLYQDYGKNKLFWYWKDDFEDTSKTKLKKWISTTIDATILTLGHYPFDLHCHFHLSNNQSQAVSFGHTKRGKKQAVHFYVSPNYSIEKFLEDWKAPHEISHLSLPFVGDANSWFSEGYATYMSRKIMIEMGYFTPTEFDSIYKENIIDTKIVYNSPTSTFVEVSDSLLKHHNYSKMYWGSTSFFYLADKKLQKVHNTDLVSTIRLYQDCCRLKDESLEDVINSLDSISSSTVFSDLLNDYQSKKSVTIMNRI